MPTSYPSTRIDYVDPFSSYRAARLTDALQNSWLQDMSGEQAPGSPWSPDSRYLCYARGSGPKPEGVYVMDVPTGIETNLVGLSAFNSYPVWSRDGSNELYYYLQSGGNVLVRAVHAVTGAVRTIATVASNGERQKIGVNADGSVLSAHIKPTGGGDYRTILANVDGSGILAGWGIGGPASADGSYWHQTDAGLIIASDQTDGNTAQSGSLRDTGTRVAVNARDFRISHAAMHPDGTRIFQIDSGTYVDLATFANVFNCGGQGQTHPFFFPTDAGLGLSARAVFDEAPFFTVDPWSRPSLWITTMAQCQSALGGPNESQCHREGLEVGMHWSDSSSNGAHPHPVPSPDGTMIAWVSDQDWDGGFSIPGGAGGPTAIWVLFLTGAAGPRAGRRWMARGLA